jgi:tryptophanyl-tRNA synthetase
MQDAMPEDAQCLFFLADLHAITVHNDPAVLAANVREMAATIIACGIDPARAVLFRPGACPRPCRTVLAAERHRADRLAEPDDPVQGEVGKNREGASVGLYAYPVLQAADVLLYQTTHVPVGEDQKQHLELARDIATKFNLDTATETFVCRADHPARRARIMSLRDGSAKMSKSDPSDASRIALTDDADAIAAKIRKAKTDAEPIPGAVEGLADRPEARNLSASTPR